MKRPQFSIATLLWLTTVVAAFCAGLHARWEIAERMDSLEARQFILDHGMTDLRYRVNNGPTWAEYDQLSGMDDILVPQIQALQIQVGGLQQDAKERALPPH